MSAATPARQSFEQGYRPDVDGLRAVAILGVIAFHASPRFAPGGFTGVDVFFVISGFLITGTLVAQLADDRFSFADFYVRRIRRIVPALLVVLAACWAIGWFVLIGDEYVELQKHIAGGAAFLSNLQLWREAGYFDPPSAAKPLLHLWSLGIEEQFYLIWPPLLYWCWKRGLNIVTLIVLIIALSFSANIASIDRDAVAAFYSPASRMWELLAGGLLAYVEFRHKERVDRAVERVLFSSGQPPDERLLANLKTWVGAILIAWGLFVFDRATAFPGWRSVLPVAGTMLVIWAGPSAWLNRAILSRRPLVQLGLISFPLYLWHWPLLSFIGITESGHPSKRLRLMAIALSVLLAWITYVCVERPARRTMSIRTPLRIAAVGLLLICLGSASLFSYVTGTPGPRTPGFATDVVSHPTALRDECRAQFPTDGEFCIEYAADLRTTTALLGDSHAEHFLQGVGAALAAKGENVVLLGQLGCPPVFDIATVKPGERNTCTAAVNSVITLAGTSPVIKRAILSFRGAFEMGGAYTLAGTTLGPAESMTRALARTVEYLLGKDKEVWLILQVPELDFEISECIGRPVTFEQHGRTPCAVPRADVMRAQAPFRKLVEDLRHRMPALKVFDPMSALCDNQWCYAVGGGHVLYNDRQHLTVVGSRFFTNQFHFN